MALWEQREDDGGKTMSGVCSAPWAGGAQGQGMEGVPEQEEARQSGNGQLRQNE